MVCARLGRQQVGFQTKREILMPGSYQILRNRGAFRGLAQSESAFYRVLAGRISPLAWVVTFCFSFPSR